LILIFVSRAIQKTRTGRWISKDEGPRTPDSEVKENVMKLFKPIKYRVGILAILGTLYFSPALAVVGTTASADCGRSDFAVGFLPAPATCKYPNVGTQIGDFGNPIYLDQFCSGSLIFKDDNKAVFLGAAHCIEGFEQAGIYSISFAPQPSIPFSLVQVLPGFRDSARLIAGDNSDLIPVAQINGLNAIRVHPLRSFLPNGVRNFVENDMAVWFMDMKDPTVASLLDGVTPLALAPEGLLGTYSKQLRDLDFTVVGYSKLVPAGATNTSPVPGQFIKEIGQHNRQYGPLTVYSINSVWIKTEEKIINQQTISCQGDSGGPLLLEVGDEALIVGLVSYGVGCGQTAENVYTRTDTPDSVKFLQCVTNSVLTITESLACIDSAF
jgi:hypothetical protein